MNGAVVSCPKLIPSWKNSTLATPAAAVVLAGLVMEIVGNGLVGSITVTVTGADIAVATREMTLLQTSIQPQEMADLVAFHSKNHGCVLRWNEAAIRMDFCADLFLHFLSGVLPRLDSAIQVVNGFEI